MKEHKMNDFETKQIKFMLKNLIRWQLESVENVKEQYFGIQAGQFVVNYLHDLGMFVKSHNLNITDEEWQKLYVECSDKARTEFLEESNKVLNN